LEAADELDTGTQGVLNEAEMLTSVSGWLHESPWAKGKQTAGLPQYLGTTQISDFPPGVKSGLDDMVRYETQQLAGLSDETFVHDFKVLPPGHGWRNPIVIGLCRESVVEQRVHGMEAAGLKPTSLGMTGLAALNALYFLHPELTDDTNEPHVLVDIGQDSAIIVVFVGIRPLYTGTLDFGARMFTDSLLERVGGDERKAEERKREMDVQDAAPSSVVRNLMRRLDSEIQNALEHWREQQPGPLAEAPINAFWMCGGGARQKGLAEYLEERYECPVHRFGPAVPDSPDDFMPEYATALGLALQGLGAATVRLSLMPPEAKWVLKRQRRLPWLLGAVGAASLAIITLVVSFYAGARRDRDDLERRMAELSSCEAQIGRLRGMQQGIRSYEESIVPLVEIGSRGRHVLQCLEDLATVKEEDMWLVYLGDDLSYESNKSIGRNGRPRNPSPMLGTPGAFGSLGIGGDIPEEFPTTMTPLQVPQVKALIMAAYTPFIITDTYGTQTRLKEKLQALKSYPGADSLAPAELRGREDIFRQWDEFFKRNPDVSYRPFALRLPFASLPVRIPEPTQEEGR
jgi:type IV pilus assembly protein PilM